ncbi:hypothetical protein [Marinicauda sp. Alg238-R41]|uniref:hypothetical protein n=1 Tax=Marinicauda sp. Alg238-R41 TaxID=2993447 RepID=UPI0022E39222|nr:hypothetical protein [Marinicauda sp. Alg238-R41]
MDWEQLVSEGHVRAARLRAAQPAVLFTAIALCLIGAYLIMQVEPAPVRALDQGARLERHQKTSNQLRAFFRTLPEIALTGEEQAQLAPAHEIERIVPLILDSLNESGELPEILPMQELRASQFWSLDWPVDTLLTDSKEGLILVGAVLSDEPVMRRERTLPDPVRWIGVFRRADNEWHGYSLRFSGAYMPSETASLDPANYPVTFADLIPERLLEEASE